MISLAQIYLNTVFLSSYDPVDGFLLHMIEPSGHVYAYHSYAHGKGR